MVWELGAGNRPLLPDPAHIFNAGQFSEVHILRTYLEFLEANLTSDKKFNIPASTVYCPPDHIIPV